MILDESHIPTEVELVFELMPCQASRVAQNPGSLPHACTYFRRWGTYHSFDLTKAGPPKPGESTISDYVGRAPLVPEMLSGCRKAPIMAVGINPNLPGWWPHLRGSLNPLFDDYQQYAHYFRYRKTAKPELSAEDYRAFGGGEHDVPPHSHLELQVPLDASGHRIITLHWREQAMYREYQALLDGLSATTGWPVGSLTVGEDLSYGNMVACPSARWTTQPLPTEPNVPIMSEPERRGIVAECFSARRYFLRQLFQSLPTVLLVFSQNTATAFIQALKGNFSAGNPQPNETIDSLMSREVTLHYGSLPDGTRLDARVIFGPHPTGNAAAWGAAKATVIAQLAASVQSGQLQFNSVTGALTRPPGTCSFCPVMGIGQCDYASDLTPLAATPHFMIEAAVGIRGDKPVQNKLLEYFVKRLDPSEGTWSGSDDLEGSSVAPIQAV